jgi:hypothetical protein
MFRSMLLLGSELHVYSDHKNLSHPLSAYASKRVSRWRLVVKDYAPTFHYIPGPENILADALSHFPQLNLGKRRVSPVQILQLQLIILSLSTAKICWNAF